MTHIGRPEERKLLSPFGVAVLTQMLVFPLFGFQASLDQNLGIGAIFTSVSLVRSYVLRRMFNLAQRTRC